MTASELEENIDNEIVILHSCLEEMGDIPSDIELKFRKSLIRIFSFLNEYVDDENQRRTNP